MSSLVTVGAHAFGLAGWSALNAHAARRMRACLRTGPDLKGGRIDRKGPRVPNANRRRTLAALIVATVACTVAGAGAAAEKPPRPVVRIGESAVWPSTPLHWTLKRIGRAQARAHACERELGIPETPASTAAIRGLAYARWVLARWQGLERGVCAIARRLTNPVAAIRAVWGAAEAPAALSVSRCESGYSVNATNGQYLGLFQMGSGERARYGHGPTALEQARAAHRYYVASGRDWSPWSCKPWRGAV